jgi:hypothetical protein
LIAGKKRNCFWAVVSGLEKIYSELLKQTYRLSTCKKNPKKACLRGSWIYAMLRASKKINIRYLWNK